MEHKLAKRLFDIVISFFGLIVAAPLIGVIALLIKLESRGPVFYRCIRGGRGGSLFGMLKFRTMVNNADNVDCKLCSSGDVRVTSLGRFLRRTKLNELPQLINVLVGDMSMVGPRPEDPKFLHYYRDQWKKVLSARPGIVGPNQIAHRNEEDLLAIADDPEEYYVESILPDKLQTDIEYVNNNDLWSDFLIVCKGAYVTIFKGYSFRKLSADPRMVGLATADVLMALLSYLTANLVRFESIPIDDYILDSLVIIAVSTPLVFAFMGTYRRSLRFFSVPDLFLLIRVSLISCAILMVSGYFLRVGSGHSRVVYLLYPNILFFITSGARLAARIYIERRELRRQTSGEKIRTLIYGAGRLGTETLRRCKFQSGINVVGFVDDNLTMRDRTILGIKVLGSGSDLSFLQSLYHVEQVIIAFKSAPAAVVARARRRCRDAGMKEAFFSTDEWKRFETKDPSDAQRKRFVEELKISPIKLTRQKILPMAQDATIAVVGPGDAFGKRLCQELIDLQVRNLILVEGCEARLARIYNFLMSSYPNGVSVLPYYLPTGCPSIGDSDLIFGHADWIIYNRPNRPMIAASLNKSTMVKQYFSDAAQFMELAVRCGCKGFSLLSPYEKDCFSDEEKALHLLTEDYFKQWTKNGGTNISSGIIRIPNVLENASEIFTAACDQRVQGISIDCPGPTLRFTTAANAARLCLNSLPLHRKGETFFTRSGIELELGSLVEEFFHYLGNGYLECDSSGHVMTGVEHKIFLRHPPNLSTTIDTACPELLMLVENENREEQTSSKLQAVNALRPFCHQRG